MASGVFLTTWPLSSENALLMDVLEHKKILYFLIYFNIVWDHPYGV